MLDQLAKKFNTDKSSLDHDYIKYYEKYFEPIRNDVNKLLELGIYTTSSPSQIEGSGASLKMWSEYFDNNIIIGCDIHDFSCLTQYNERIRTIEANCEMRSYKDLEKIHDPWLRQLYSSSPTAQNGLDWIIQNYGTRYDIIIDDGPHTMSGQQIFLGYMFKYLKPGGIFVIEDLHTSYIMPHLYNSNPMTKITTLKMLQKYLETGEIESDFMLPEEIQYLKDNIEKMVIEKGKNSEICFIWKKS